MRLNFGLLVCLRPCETLRLDDIGNLNVFIVMYEIEMVFLALVDCYGGFGGVEEEACAII